MENQINQKQNKIGMGLCIRCGNPLDRAGVHCSKCRNKINAATRERRQWYLDHKICPRCGKIDLMGDETICPECRAYETNLALKKRDKESYNAYHNNWSKSTYKKRKEAGICVRCGKKLATKGKATCALCRAKQNEKRRVRTGLSDRSEHIANGLCYFCDEPVKPGYKVCEKHYQMNIIKLKNGRKSEKSQEYIKMMNRISYGRRGK